MFRISDEGIALIKRFEGLELEAYYDIVGVLTIGYGHTGDDVFEGQVISEREAEEILRRDLDRFERGVNDAVKAPITQSMFDALVSLAFNIGVSAMKGSTAIKRTNQRNYQGAAEAITWWNKAGGSVVPGLVRRRSAESALFLSEVDKVAVDAPDENIRGAVVEESKPKGTSVGRTSAGAATAGTAGAAGAGSVLLDGDDEEEVEVTPPEEVPSETPAEGTDEPAAPEDDATTDDGAQDDTGEPTTETPEASDDTSDEPSTDDEPDAADGIVPDVADNDEATPAPDQSAETPDSADDTEAGDGTTTSTEQPQPAPSQISKEETTDAIVVVAGVFAVLAAIYIIWRSVNDWRESR